MMSIMMLMNQQEQDLGRNLKALAERELLQLIHPVQLLLVLMNTLPEKKKKHVEYLS